jgi:naphtho-gamma-pyrone polyketide synthase
MIGRLVTIIAEEVGVDKSELTPEASFVDMGIDSLLSLNIAGRLHELGLDLESHTLADFATVADLTKYLSSTNVPPSNHQYDTPKLVKSDSSSSSADAVDTDPTDLGEEDLDITGIVRRTIAEEVGVKEDEIDGTLDLAELGLDSLMALTILGKLRDEMDIDLPSGIFADHSTLNSLGDALGFNLKPAVSSNETRRDLSSNKTGRTNIIVPRASSVLSQGNGKSESKTLFLFPDGSGSATSYAPLGRISAGIAVVGLNCPFIKTPENLKCSVEDITPAYLAEIRRRQPHGPYYLGGWSAGGICAFDAAQELERCGERVERLILIDSPNPIGLEKLPPRLYDFFETIGLFGDGNNPPPKWLLPHFLAFVDSLDKYRPVPFKPGRAPQTYIIWARDGVCKFPESPRPDWTEGATREMKWLLNNRTDFGPNSWDKLIEAEKLVIKTLDDANHFSMMTRGKAQELATLIKAAMV